VPGAARLRHGRHALDLHADRVDVVELARLDDLHAHPARAELADQDVGDPLGEGFEQRQPVVDEQPPQPLGDDPVVDRVVDAVGLAGARMRHAGVHVDHERLRTMQLRFVDADDRLAREAFDEDQVHGRRRGEWSNPLGGKGVAFDHARGPSGVRWTAKLRIRRRNASSMPVTGCRNLAERIQRFACCARVALG